MALADLNDQQAVRDALDEFDSMGREAFLAKYGFGEARDYFVVVRGYNSSQNTYGITIKVE